MIQLCFNQHNPSISWSFRKLKSDKWTNKLLNLCIIKDQLLHKLQARKAELSVLDQSNAVQVLDQSM